MPPQYRPCSTSAVSISPSGMALEVDANVKIKALAFTAAALASFGRKSRKRNDASQFRLTLRPTLVCINRGLWSDTITVEHGVAGGRKVGARHRQESRPRCRKRGYDSSFSQIHFPGTESLLKRPSFPDRHVLHTKLRRQLSLSLPPQPTLITPPLKTWAQHGAPAFATSFFPLAQSAAPTAWKESLGEHQNCLDHSWNHPAVPPRIAAGTTMKNATTLSSEFQITIPKEVRESQNWKPGQEFAFIPKDRGYLLVISPTIQDYAASPRVPAPTTTAIARTATDVHCRYLGLDRAAHRLPVGESIARHLPERHSWPVPTIVQLEPAKWLTCERGEISLRSPLAPSVCLAAKACRTSSIA